MMIDIRPLGWVGCALAQGRLFCTVGFCVSALCALQMCLTWCVGSCRQSHGCLNVCRMSFRVTYNRPGHLRRTKVRRTGSKKSGVFLKCLVVRRLLLNPLFRPGPLCKREGLGAFFKAKILRLRSPLYHERVEGGEQLLHNVLKIGDGRAFQHKS